MDGVMVVMVNLEGITIITARKPVKYVYKWLSTKVSNNYLFRGSTQLPSPAMKEIPKINNI